MTNFQDRDYVYDIESYPNIFSLSAKRIKTGDRFLYEISEWKNEGEELYEFLMALKTFGARMVGYNNLSYDYPMVHFIINKRGVVSPEELHDLTSLLISNKFAFSPVKNKDIEIKQVDLLKIHHFDNPARMTSLKTLEFNMGSQNIRDLPFTPGTILTLKQARELLSYNDHDVDETEKFYHYTKDKLLMREDLSNKFGSDFTNFSDKRIGTEIFLSFLKKASVPLFTPSGGRIQTRRGSIKTKDIILPYIEFESDEFNRIKDRFSASVITETKGFFKGLSVDYEGVNFVFGTGGLHASRKNFTARANGELMILDIDVKSFYPNLSIKNKMYPEHLTEAFCSVYEYIYEERKKFDKGSAENGAFKLALNGAYGDSNSEYSSFYDPKFTMSITINGQLLLCMLIEQLVKTPSLTLLQVNTDGITVHFPKRFHPYVKEVCKWWEQVTGLELESDDYQAMFIRDVNNYMAVKNDGGVKRIGAYAYVRERDAPGTREVTWNKNHGGLVIPKAAEAALVTGTDIETFIKTHRVEEDFTMVTKVPRSSRLDLVFEEETIVIQNISRYVVSNNGGKLIKVMPPTPAQIEKWRNGDHYNHSVTGNRVVVNKGKKPPSGKYHKIILDDEELSRPPNRKISIESGHLVTEVSDMRVFHRGLINYEYYIEEAKKLVEPLLKGESI